MPREDLVFDPTLMDSLDEDTTPLPAEFDVDADYNAPPPPLPDGWYLATLRCAGVRDGDKTVPFRKRPWGNIPSTYHTSIEAQIVDPGGPQNGKFATDNTVTTHADARRHNTSKVATFYRGITGQPIPGVSEAQHMSMLLRELQSFPTVYIKTQLEGQAQEAGKEFGARKAAHTLSPGEKGPKTFRGEKSFMENGKLTGRAWDESAKEWVVGRPQIVDVKPSTWTPPSAK
jgi:hypothetical protein